MTLTTSTNTDTRPVAYILVGVPGSGKTTWVQNQVLVNPYAYLSTDQYIEEYAESVGKSYSDVFQLYMPLAIERMVNDAITARNSQQNIIWDQTSVTKESRSRKLDMIIGYRAVAVVFETAPREELNVRLTSRPGKVIPKYVVDNFISTFEEPALEEGFDEIIKI
jgi:predicted kinase